MHNHHLNPTLVVLMCLDVSGIKGVKCLHFHKDLCKNNCTYDIANGS